MTSIAGYYNINLLHNADWGYSLVNQRIHNGAISNNFCIDRWIGNGTVTPSNNGDYVTLAAGTTMKQNMEIIPNALTGQYVTVAYQDDNNNIYSTQIQFPSTTSDTSTTTTCGYRMTVTVGFKSGSYTLNTISCTSVPYIIFNNNSNAAINIKRVWMELGAVCHLATTPPNDFITNLLICSRYFYFTSNMSRFLRAARITTQEIYFDLSIPVPLRRSPSAIDSFIVVDSNVAQTRLYYKQSGSDTFSLFSSASDTIKYSVATAWPYSVLRVLAQRFNSAGTKINHGMVDATLNIASLGFSAELL